MLISLREIVAPTVRRITALGVAPEQQPCVAGNASSLAEALFNEELWYRAVQGGLDLVAHVVPARPG